MEGKDGVVVSAEPASESEGGLRLRPLKTVRNPGTLPIASYLEETWDDEPMTPAGRVFIDPLFDCVCVCILGFKNPIDRQTFKKNVEMTLMKHKRFSSRVEMRDGRPWWTQVKPNVDDHVIESNLSPVELEETDCVLNYATDVVLSKPFDRSKPLWDIHLVDGKFKGASSCCIIRIHHTLGDGTSLISLLIACCRKTEVPDLLPTLPGDSAFKKPTQKSACIWINFQQAIWRFVLLFWYSLTEIGKFVASLIWLKDTPTPMKGDAGCEHFPKTFRFETIDVEDLKYVSKAVGGTINDVFVAMAANGMRRYMEHRIRSQPSSEEGERSKGEKVGSEDAVSHGRKPESEETAGKHRNLDHARVRALALINTRPIPGLPELAEMMSGKTSQARWGNHMGYLLLKLPMKLNTDPLEIVRQSIAIGHVKKSSMEGPFTYASGAATMKLLGAKIAAALVYKTAVHTTMSMSNVKGPAQEVMFGDNPITHIIPSVVGQPHALCLHLQSYNGRVFLVAMVAKTIIPDPEYLLRLCLDSLQEMKKAAAELLQER